MVKAAADGKIDFSNFDPWNKQWWQRLNMLLYGIEKNTEYNLNNILLLHHEISRLAKVEKAVERTHEKIDKLIELAYPWVEQEKEETPEDALEAYRKQFGRPGEPRYEAMIQELKKQLVKLTPAQVLMQRKQREHAMKGK